MEALLVLVLLHETLAQKGTGWQTLTGRLLELMMYWRFKESGDAARSGAMTPLLVSHTGFRNMLVASSSSLC